MLPIELRSVKLHRGSFTLDLSLCIPGAGISVILGPSGCGKTTLLDLCAGFIQADEGRIYQGRQDISNLAPEKRNIGVVFQDHALFPYMSVLGNAAFGPRMRGKSRNEAKRIAREKLDLVGLGDLARRKPDSLSGGERQRVSLARALATNPSLLLLDEPLSSLDLLLRRNLGRELRRIIDQSGVTAILVTHDQEEALSLADFLAVMNKGRIVRSGSPIDVWQDPRDPFTASFLGRRTWLKIQEISRDTDGLMSIKTSAGTLSLSKNLPDIDLAAALMLRSESLRINPNGCIGGCVTRRQYTGSGWQLELEPLKGTAGEIIAADWNEQESPPQKGEFMSFDVLESGIRIMEDRNA